jgi:hypothetical protein
VGFLEDQLGIQCYDSETTPELREALQANVEDETTTNSDIIDYVETWVSTEDRLEDKLTDFEKRVLRG